MTLRRSLIAATILAMQFDLSAALAQTAPSQTATPQKPATSGHRHVAKAGKKAGAPKAHAATASAATPGVVPAAAVSTAAVAPVVPVAPVYHAPPPDAGEAVIVTGTHAYNRHARDSTAPITVISAATLQRTGAVNLADALTRMDPSITEQTMGADAGALTSSIRMRGLNPNEVLVLVDGKRRHTTANIYADQGPQQGSTPVDLNMLPANAIDHIEILRDGAAAMYGSDAIAGVVNIITKKTAHGLNLTGQTGANAYNGDGWQYQTGIDGGFSFLGDGYVHISGQVEHADHMVPKGASDLRTDPNNADYGGVNFPSNSNMIMSTPEETRENLLINFGKTVTEGIDFYGQITYAHRHSEAYENYRTPTKAPQIYPAGFSPLETIDENDFAATLGLKGDNFLGFDWDVSTTYGQDDDTIGNKNTANPNMLSTDPTVCGTNPANAATYSTDGCGWSPTTVLAERYSLAQWTNNADFRRRLKIANVVPVTVAFGAEHRLEQYQIWPGNPPSYQIGGTQGYAGLMPENAGKWGRDIWAGYLDGDFHLLPHWDLDFAGRFEHYTDFGNTENGKVSTRYDFTKRIAIRGTVSNGFRAPTLPEEHFSALNVSPTGATGLLSTTSAAGQSVGALPLKPERSFSAEAGLVLEPIDGWHVSADVYQINIRDRIFGSSTFSDSDALNAIAMTGASLPAGITNSDVFVNYFANVGSTKTQGLDIMSDYLLRLNQYGNVDLSLGVNLNRTKVTRTNTLANSLPALNAQTASYLTNGAPKNKIVLQAHWTIGQWDVNVRQTRYGATTILQTYEDQAPEALQYSNTQWLSFKNTAAWMTDLEVGYRLNHIWHFAVGANNIFNVRPRRLPLIVNYLGANQFDQNSSGIPFTGGYYYGRINASF
ncbi:TonB-dependent receptor plug [Gluconacetobacter diazotrophicus PA1 5]|uniref:TonB-dependent receptor plug domain-containing protein n=1 Tax=Gluconacetobacter diazotrophicus TaxID=33996 RepID=UPI000173D734|nr:TonB-dependent receptor [Gluconacetobacter diazotrophicus]ACI52335.1 TonB-dependent receptor plug [Gluconacetobacter diazotrophicus PA1 5]